VQGGFEELRGPKAKQKSKHPPKARGKNTICDCRRDPVCRSSGTAFPRAPGKEEEDTLSHGALE